jgi:hypothetical protein
MPLLLLHVPSRGGVNLKLRCIVGVTTDLFSFCRIWSGSYELLFGDSCVDLFLAACCRALLISAGISYFTCVGGEAGIDALVNMDTLPHEESDGNPAQSGNSINDYAFRRSSMSSGAPRVSMPVLGRGKGNQDESTWQEPLLRGDDINMSAESFHVGSTHQVNGADDEATAAAAAAAAKAKLKAEKEGTDKAEALTASVQGQLVTLIYLCASTQVIRYVVLMRN